MIESMHNSFISGLEQRKRRKYIQYHLTTYHYMASCKELILNLHSVSVNLSNVKIHYCNLHDCKNWRQLVHIPCHYLPAPLDEVAIMNGLFVYLLLNLLPTPITICVCSGDVDKGFQAGHLFGQVYGPTRSEDVHVDRNP